ncbi:unnamed protein product [Candidula unifasciata]|uniref:VWFA domain-containing protein n=1 Tax=Candidula unifasciata TaxID=100452 RepID=A0A8S3Z0B6_9EUPU|nr:unnamed protein product [Candidula unifasciata]
MSAAGNPADIFFVLDSSSSIWKPDFEKRMLGFVRDVVASFDIGRDLTRVGVMTFSDTPRLVIGLDSYTNKQDLLQAISPQIVRYTLGGTNTAEALQDVRKNGFHESITREGVVKIAIVITDGQSWNEKKTIKEAELLKENGVKVYAIGVGKAVKQEELEGIANQPKEEFVFSVNDFGALSEIKDTLAVKACGYEEAFKDQPVCGSGPTDITFAFDASTLTVKNKHQTLGQIQDFTKRLSSINGDVRIGVTSGPCPPSMDFPPSVPSDASDKLRRVKRSIRSNVLGVVKQWRHKTVGDLKKTSSEEGVSKYDSDPAFYASKKGLVLLLNKDNVPEFRHLKEEVLLLIDSGVEVMVVLDESVERKEVDRWTELIGHRRVLSGVDPNNDYSGYVMEFVCSL